MMKKIISYFFLLLVSSFLLSLYLKSAKASEKHIDRIDNELERNTLLAKNHLIKFLNIGTGYTLGDKEKGEFTIYKIQRYTGDQRYDLLKQEIRDHLGRTLLIDAENSSSDHNIKYSETLQNIHIDEIRKQIFDSPFVNIDFQEEPPSDNSDGFLGVIDDSLFIFLAIALLIVMLLLILELPIYLVRRYKGRDVLLVVYIVAVSLLIFFFQTLMAPGLWPQVPVETIVRPMLLFLPTFVCYQWLRSRSMTKLDFLDQQLIKFIIIFFVGLIGIYLADGFSSYIASTQKRGVVISNNTWMIAMTYSFALGNLFFNLIKHGWTLRRADKNLAVAKRQVLSSESKLQTLQSSVNPHFLYNALNSISSLAKIDPDKTQKMTMALSEFYRYHTNRDQEDLTTVQDEISMLEKYIEIEKIRFEDRLLYEVEVDEDSLKYRIPHFLLQPLVENAIKYGYDKTTEKIKVKLKIWRSNSKLNIEIHDSGQHFDENLDIGYGLKSVLQKLKLLFPEKHEISFLNVPQKHIFITLNGAYD